MREKERLAQPRYVPGMDLIDVDGMRFASNPTTELAYHVYFVHQGNLCDSWVLSSLLKSPASVDMIPDAQQRDEELMKRQRMVQDYLERSVKLPTVEQYQERQRKLNVLAQKKRLRKKA